MKYGIDAYKGGAVKQGTKLLDNIDEAIKLAYAVANHKVKEVSKRLITGGLLCIAIGVVQGFAVQMLGLSSVFPNYIQLFSMLLLVGIAGIVIGVIMLLFIWLINMVNKL